MFGVQAYALVAVSIAALEFDLCYRFKRSHFDMLAL